LRRTLQSDEFLRNSLAVWSKDIKGPLNSIIRSDVVRPIHSLVKNKLRASVDDSLNEDFYRTWNGFNLGVMLLRGFRNQIIYKESIIEQNEGKIGLSDMFKMTSIALRRDVFSVASFFCDVNPFFNQKIDIYIKVDPRLTVISSDSTMLRTIMINAFHLALKNIKYGATVSKFNVAQSIVVQVDVLEPESLCLSRRGSIQRPAGNLSFNEARLMRFKMFDTGSFEDKSVSSDDDRQRRAQEVHELSGYDNVCQDLIGRCCKLLQCCDKQCTFSHCFSRKDISESGGMYKCLQEFTIPFKYNPVSVKIRNDPELMGMIDRYEVGGDIEKRRAKHDKWQHKMRHFRDYYDEGIDDRNLTNINSIMLLLFAHDGCSELQLQRHAIDLKAKFETYYWNFSYLICNESTRFGPFIDNIDCVLIDVSSYAAFCSQSTPGRIEITDKLQLLGFANVIAGYGSPSDPIDPFLDKQLNLAADAKISSATSDYEMNGLIRKCNSRLRSLLIGEHEGGGGIFRSIFEEDD
jgi:hypothetical protein